MEPPLVEGEIGRKRQAASGEGNQQRSKQYVAKRARPAGLAFGGGGTAGSADAEVALDDGADGVPANNGSNDFNWWAARSASVCWTGGKFATSWLRSHGHLVGLSGEVGFWLESSAGAGISRWQHDLTGFGGKSVACRGDAGGDIEKAQQQGADPYRVAIRYQKVSSGRITPVLLARGSQKAMPDRPS